MIDTRGFGCPTPVLMVREALQKDAPAALEVLADARVAVENVTRLARSMGYSVAEASDGPDCTLKLPRQ